MTYLLDTNICIYALNRRPPGVIARLQALGAQEVGLSSITAAELAFGVAKSVRPASRELLEAFLGLFAIEPWNHDVIWHYADIRLALERAGKPIGERDTLIAAHARALDATLVTNNLREFARVPGLRLENWVA